jgi:uncharacterized protein (TIGR00369 family)
MTDTTHPSQFMSLLDIQFDGLGPTRVSGSVAADERHHQPWGLVHGGLYTAAIETFATIGAYEAVKERGQQAVGVPNVTDFLRTGHRGLQRVRRDVRTDAVRRADRGHGRSTARSARR